MVAIWEMFLFSWQASPGDGGEACQERELRCQMAEIKIPAGFEQDVRRVQRLAANSNRDPQAFVQLIQVYPIPM